MSQDFLSGVLFAASFMPLLIFITVILTELRIMNAVLKSKGMKRRKKPTRRRTTVPPAPPRPPD